MTAAADRTEIPTLGRHSIPRFFGGGANALGSKADLDFEHALLALQALTGRPADDPALIYISDDLCQAVSDLIAETAHYVSLYGDVSLGSTDDETFMRITGEEVPYEKAHTSPAPKHWGVLPGSQRPGR